MGELSSAYEQLPIELCFGPISNKEVGKFEFISISGVHLSSSPVAPDPIKFLA